jgi:histidyl-tRNA synthetase
MFRHEKKQKGRWRQFYQIGAEALGSDHPAVEAEVIDMVVSFLAALGVRTHLLINSVGDGNCRPQYVALLRGVLQSRMASLCEDCRRRAETNPLRVLDCKNESCQPVLRELPRIVDHLCGECAEHFEQVRGHLSRAGIASEVAPQLVRGLDYYVKTAFEIVSGDLGAQNAIVGGGRYDGLAESLGGPRVPGFGFALGLDRLVMVLPADVRERAQHPPDLYLAYLGDAAFRESMSLARRLRRKRISCRLEFAGGSLKSQLRHAHRLGARHVLILGDSELASGRFQLKSMDGSLQREVTLEELEDHLVPRGGGGA